jgi:hypothetical protein
MPSRPARGARSERDVTNAAFLVEGIERVPCELCLADEVTVHFP